MGSNLLKVSNGSFSALKNDEDEIKDEIGMASELK